MSYSRRLFIVCEKKAVSPFFLGDVIFALSFYGRITVCERWTVVRTTQTVYQCGVDVWSLSSDDYWFLGYW